MASSSSDTTTSSLTISIDKSAILTVANDPSTIKKGLLWQQRDRFFSRWKERYFVLTKDYLSCFKKGSKVGTSEMGSFIYKLNLVDVEGLNWADKKRDGVIAIRVAGTAGTAITGQLLLWSTAGLDDWMYALLNAVNASKGRREALRKSQTLLPSMTKSFWSRQKLPMDQTLSDSPIGCHTTSRLQRATSADLSCSQDVNRQLRSTIHHDPTPVQNRRLQRISVLTNIDLANLCSEIPSLASHNYSSRTTNKSGLPRLAPQCGGGGSSTNQVGSSSQHSSLQSLVSLGRTSSASNQPHLTQLQKPSPRSLQVSPALAQRSLYAQHILAAPEIAAVNTTDSRQHQHAKSALKTATSEFSFIRPDSPLTLPYNNNNQNFVNHSARTLLELDASRIRPVYCRSQSCLEAQQRQKPSNNSTLQASKSATTKKSQKERISQTTRPSSIYGQPSLTEKSFIGNRHNYYPSEIVSSSNTSVSLSGNGLKNSGHSARDSKSMPKRHNRQHKQLKSDSAFATAGRSHSSANNNGILQTNSVVPENFVSRNKIHAVR